MIHVDVTKFANIPHGGGHKFLSRLQCKRNASATGHRTDECGGQATGYRPRMGIAFAHAVFDDHSRMAYAEIRTDERPRAATAIAVLQRAMAWFAEHRDNVQLVLSDRSAYRSYAN